jgi:hypothetical protein
LPTPRTRHTIPKDPRTENSDMATKADPSSDRARHCRCQVAPTRQRHSAGRTAAAAVLAVGCTSAAGTLIPCGNFDTCLPEFTSDYAYWSAVPPPNMGEGYHSVVSRVSEVHNIWPDSIRDHTTGNGRFFVANGSGDTSDIVGQTVNPIVITKAGTPYRFEAYITTVYYVSNAAPGPTLTFQVGNGAEWYDMGTSQSFPNGYTPGEWRLTYYDGVFETTGEYFIRLKNAQSAAEGNDMGLDDLYFGLRSDAPSYPDNPGDTSPPIIGVPPTNVSTPTTLALLLAGAIGARLILARRRPRKSGG